MLRSLPLAALLILHLASSAAAQQLPVGQGQEEYEAWLAADPAGRAAVLSFEAWQRAAGVESILPTWQITRTASMWRQCSGPPFQVPPPQLWPHIATTLRYIHNHVRPVVGAVEAVSGYRNPGLNTCAGGAATSAHKDYFALDLITVRPVPRPALFRGLCAIHRLRGPKYGIGLGFYAFQRFHVDSRSFRRWGASGTSEASPCAALERGEDPA